MFDAIRNNKIIIQFVLALIVLPFAFWGVESYVSNAGGGDAATVGGSPISAEEFQQALREHQDRLRPALDGQVDPAILDNPKLREEIIERLAQERMFALYADKARLMTSNEQLAQLIASEPSLQENGQFSPQRYQALVAAQGMNEAMFEARLRKNLTLQQAPMAIGATVSGPTASERWLVGQLEEREISEVLHRPESKMASVKITPEAIAAYFEANKFEIPEQVRAEYVVLDGTAKVDQAAKYAEIAEGFSNAVYEQSDSLEPAAKKYGLTIKKSDWLSRGAPVDVKTGSPFSNAKLMAALFSEEAIKNKRNTEAIELGAEGIVSARVVEHRPATVQPLETVSAAIEKRLARQEAAQLTLKAGEENLARLNKGDSVNLVWGTQRTVQRSFAPNLSKDAVRAVFQVAAEKLPAYAGVPLPGGEGYALYRISKAKPYVIESGEPSASAKALRGQYARLVAEEEFAAWTAILRDRYPVEINKKMLEVGK
ncbi:MAG: SurA N-terminal domain-containing protein [Rhodocyclaceae bacterium]|nr:SurA N-terminal domain-containing protein [Rhodocyclaceae bacterium]